VVVNLLTFLDVGGTANAETVEAGFRIIFKKTPK
jgi:succinyl-CoA synthetase beta subunit